MRPNVAADLAEARRRTDLHLGRRRAPVIDRDFLFPDAPPFQSEDEYAESLPSGGALGWLVATLAGLLAVAALAWASWAPKLGWLR